MDIRANRCVNVYMVANGSRKLSPLRVRFRAAALVGLITMLICAARQATHADNSTEKKRALMATVKRLVVIPPYFATDTLTKADAVQKSDRSSGAQASAGTAADARLTAYAAQLRKLTDHAAAILPVRAAARTPFTVVPMEEVTAALKALEWTPDKLFQNGGRMRGARYPTPDPEAVKKLAARLHADAVLLTALDEPRRKNGRAVFNLLTGLDIRSAQVEARAGFFVLMADGVTALTDDVDVAHPLTHIGNREYLMTDWLEAQDVMIEDLFDEWTRYLPSSTREEGKGYSFLTFPFSLFPLPLKMAAR
jgi:hypothetical protein